MRVKRTARNIASLSLAFILLFQSATITAFAQDNIAARLWEDAKSNEGNPIEISSAEDLYEFAQLVNSGNNVHGYYKLTCDIDLSAYGAGWDNGAGWTPIGQNTYYSFGGVFDGGGHVITGLYINTPNDSRQGLFAGIAGGTVQYLGIINVNITGGDYVGGVAGGSAGSYNKNGGIKNCYVTGSISGQDWVGGLVGDAWGNTITNCFTTCDISGNDYVGGLVGIGDANGESPYKVMQGMHLENCYANGSVSGNDYIGGIVGSIGDLCNVRHCYATGNVSGNNYVGGIMGDFAYNKNIKNCTALNPSVNGNSNVGRIAGDSYIGLMEDPPPGNYAFRGMTGNIGNIRVKEGKDGADMTALEAVTKSFWIDTMLFDERNWRLDEGRLPILRGFAGQNGRPGSHLTITA